MIKNNPIEIARETLKQLSLRKLLPTPANFERIYCELTQLPRKQADGFSKSLADQLEKLPHGAIPVSSLSQLKQWLSDGSWEQAASLVTSLLRELAQTEELSQNWGELIQELIHYWDLSTLDISQHHKKITLERVLINYGKQPTNLNRKLQGMLENWRRPNGHNGLDTEVDYEPAHEMAILSPSVADQHWKAWQNLLSFVLEHGLEPHFAVFPELADALKDSQIALAQIHDEASLSAYMPRLRSLIIKMELQHQQEGRLVSGLASLLYLLLENIAEINGSDEFLLGQVRALQQLLRSEPMTMPQIYRMETSLKEVIRKQSMLKSSLDEAADSLRGLLNRFVARLALMSDSTDEFQEKLQKHSLRIQQSHDVDDLSSVIMALTEDTSLLQVNLQESKSELLSAKEQVGAAERRIAELETELQVISSKVQEDHLTGALNRQGLSEHFARETGRAERTKSPLSVALIDVDNFKQLNDKHGHLAGDDALKHLVGVIQYNLRPADVVARFGGEEFVVLMPDTGIQEGVAAIQRLQRELTKAFFLANNDRLVITFSAGVALWRGEDESEVLERADHAMYQAKLNGKNRVHSAE